MALKVNALKPVLAAVQRLSSAAPPDASLTSLQTLLLALNLSKELMLGSVEIRDSFDVLQGHDLLVPLLGVHAGRTPGQRAVQAAIAGVGETAMLKAEMNKEK